MTCREPHRRSDRGEARSPAAQRTSARPATRALRHAASALCVLACGSLALQCGSNDEESTGGSGGSGAGSLTDEPCADDGAIEACYPGPPTSREVGTCTDGERRCIVDRWSHCIGAVEPTDEVCDDGIDNDCDGETDEACPCELGTTRACYSGPPSTRGVGECTDGVQSCDEGLWGASCEGEALPSAEVCNGADDDCNGAPDDCETADGCPGCGEAAYCDNGSCVPYIYEWVVGSFGSCSVSCGDGVRTRTVVCVREDDVTVDDSFCPTPKPATSEVCHEPPCCSTDAMTSGRRCSGTTNDIINWVPFHYGSDTGSAADRDSCRADCTAWASGAGHTSWCCDLVEDSTTGTSWSCAAHTGTTTSSYSNPNSHGAYAALGSCSQ